MEGLRRTDIARPYPYRRFGVASEYGISAGSVFAGGGDGSATGNRLWHASDALVDAAGEGLREPFDRREQSILRVLKDPDDCAELARVAERESLGGDWRIGISQPSQLLLESLELRTFADSGRE